MEAQHDKEYHKGQHHNVSVNGHHTDRKGTNGICTHHCVLQTYKKVLDAMREQRYQSAISGPSAKLIALTQAGDSPAAQDSESELSRATVSFKLKHRPLPFLLHTGR